MLAPDRKSCQFDGFRGCLGHWAVVPGRIFGQGVRTLSNLCKFEAFAGWAWIDLERVTAFVAGGTLDINSTRLLP